MAARTARTVSYHEPDARRAPERAEALREWSQRQSAPDKPVVIERVVGGSTVYECPGNAAILARLSTRGGQH